MDPGDFNVSLALKLWDISNAIVVLSIANTLAFLYKILDSSFADKLRSNARTFHITLLVIFLGLIFFASVIISVQIGFTALLPQRGSAHSVWMWTTYIRLVVVVTLAFFCTWVTCVLRRKS